MSDTLLELLKTLNKVGKLEKKINILEKRIEELSKEIEKLSSKRESSDIVELLRETLGKEKQSSKEEKRKSALEYAAQAAIVHFFKDPPKRR